jgi:aspartate aminotransferase-like enzyme
MSERARQRVQATASNSFSIDLKKWCSIMETYESGGHAYHATMPTMALRDVRDAGGAGCWGRASGAWRGLRL